MADKKGMVLWLLVIPLTIVIGSRIRVYTDPFCINFNLTPDICWNLIPQTLETRYGTIHVPAFSFYDGRGGDVWGSKRLRHNLVIMGNKINQEVVRVFVDAKNASIVFKEDNLQPFTLSGIDLLIYDYMEKSDSTVLFTRLVDEIVLKDNTVIKPEYSPTFRLSENEWKAYDMRKGAELTSPQFEGTKWVSSVTFEPDWGNLISYKEKKRPD
jgi:hypothetical protein